ncbi:MAG: CDP-archaeol synthase [Candidatus Aenigmatarchaeota archaeon]
MGLDFLIKFLPAMIANSSPVIFSKLPMNIPINKKLFGKNKTWKGFILGSFSGGLTGYFLGFVNQRLNFQIGFLMGVGALFGDLIKSYFKRRLGKSEGEKWIPFDQIDWIIGSISFTFYLFSLEEIILIFLILPTLHILTNKIAVKLKLKKSI